MKRSAAKEIWSWVNSIILGLILAAVVSIFIVQPYQVQGHSMDPTLYDQEHIIVSKLSHTFSRLPDYGDIVIVDSRTARERTLKDDALENGVMQLFIKPEEGHALYIKRVIGKPGDTIEIREGKVYRNGDELEEAYIKEPMLAEDQTWTVPKNHVFVMGDNRNDSRDSRHIGFIPKDHILGKKVSNISW